MLIRDSCVERLKASFSELVVVILMTITMEANRYLCLHDCNVSRRATMGGPGGLDPCPFLGKL